jgi:NTP pyrophosphatase (non-canonical NTP hydrolase)
MDIRQYQDEAEKTLNDSADLVYLSGKLMSEASEILQPALKHKYHGKPLDADGIREEVGDCLWYIAALCSLYGWELEEVAAENIAKLRARHGEHYNSAHYTEAQP